MENKQIRTWVNLSFISLAGALGYLIFALGMYGVGVFDLEAKIKSSEWIVRVASVIGGLVAFVFLNRNLTTSKFATEVVEELGRVTWPMRRETSQATFLVIVMVLIAGFILGFLDYLLTLGVQKVF